MHREVTEASLSEWPVGRGAKDTGRQVGPTRLSQAQASLWGPRSSLPPVFPQRAPSIMFKKLLPDVMLHVVPGRTVTEDVRGPV